MINNKLKKRILYIISIIVIVVLIIAISFSILKNKNNLKQQEYAASVANANSSLVSKYIKRGITIGGIEGTLDVLDTSDATATEDNISSGKTAYVNGNKIVGTGKDVEDSYTQGYNDGSSKINLKSTTVVVQATAGNKTYTFTQGKLVGLTYAGSPWDSNNVLQGAGITNESTYWTQCAWMAGYINIQLTLVYY